MSIDALPVEPFPSLPPELVREVLEWVAWSYPTTATKLTLVASHVRLWTLPIMYNTVTLMSAHAITRFYESTLPTNGTLNPIPLSHYVKNLGVFGLGPLGTIQGVISSCTNVQNIAYSFSLASYSHMLRKTFEWSASSVSSAPEHHFLGLSCRDGLDLSCISSLATHLHVQLSPRDLPSLVSLHEHLPRLSHLAISLPSTAVATWYTVLPKITAILEAHPTLQVLYVQVARSSNGGGIDPTATKLDDDRLVVFHAPMSCIAQWGRTLHSSGGGLWKEAEKKINERKTSRKTGKRRKSSVEEALARQTFAGLRGLTALDDPDSDAFEDDDDED